MTMQSLIGMVASSFCCINSLPRIELFSEVLLCLPFVRFCPLTSIVSLPNCSEIDFKVVSSLPPRKIVESQFPVMTSHVFSYFAFNCARFWMITFSDIPMDRTKAMTLSKSGICPIFAISSIRHLTWHGRVPWYLKFARLESVSKSCVYIIEARKL